MADPKLGAIHYNWPGYDLEGFARRASEIGYKFCEVRASDIWVDDSVDGANRAEEVREILDGYGMKISAVEIGNDFLQADPSDLKMQIDRYCERCKVIPLTGCDIARSDGGWNRNDQVPKDQWDSMMLDAFKRCADVLEETGTRIALDNHGVTTNDGDWQLSLIERVGSNRLGVNLDTMNYRWYGHELSSIDRFYQILAPHVFHVHMKDGTGSRENYKGAELGAGEINLKNVVSLLKDVGYDGAWTAEYEGPEAEKGVGYEKCFRWLSENI